MAQNLDFRNSRYSLANIILKFTFKLIRRSNILGGPEQKN